MTRIVRHVLAGLVAILAMALVPDPALAQVPGIESFVRPPKTPLETWETADYLIRAGLPGQAVPFLRQFVAANPDDQTLVDVRETFGQGSFLRLIDDPATRPFAAPLLKRLAEASRKIATRPERIEAAIAALSQSREERNYGVERLREAGPYAVIPLVKALGKPDLSPEARAAIVGGLGSLDTSALPPLIATLQSPDAPVASAAAEALAAMGDERAVPALTVVAAKPAAPARDAARKAIARITGVAFDKQPKPPVRVLTDAARRAHLAIPKLPSEPATAWDWDDAAKAPAPRETTLAEAESTSGIKLAREALAIAPADRTAQGVLLALLLERDPAKATPEALGDVVRTAIADGRNDLAARAVAALGQVTDRNALVVAGKSSPLVEALDAPDRRVQFAAAEALIALDPKRSFSGSSGVVPAIARFVASGPIPRAVVIDGNPVRGSQVVGFLKGLGYDAQLTTTGDEGFRAAAESADVELVAIDPDLVRGPWRLHDTLANLRADAHTAGIPIFIVSPLALRDRLLPRLESFPKVQFLVTPTESVLFKQQLDQGLARLGARPLSNEERAAYARKASALLAQIATRPGNPFETDLPAAGQALSLALNSPATAPGAVTALGDIPKLDAQRGLADILLDPSKPLEVRIASAEALARSVRQFGALLSSAQETSIVALLDREDDPALRTAIAKVVGVLRPRPASSGRRLQAFRPSSWH
jgi:HEAT repeat protein